MKEKTLIEKQNHANRIINNINREILDRQFVLDRINSTTGAAQSYYRTEYQKIEKKLAEWREELDALNQLN
jgi:hypothetical protein